MTAEEARSRGTHQALSLVSTSPVIRAGAGSKRRSRIRTLFPVWLSQPCIAG